MFIPHRWPNHFERHKRWWDSLILLYLLTLDFVFSSFVRGCFHFPFPMDYLIEGGGRRKRSTIASLQFTSYFSKKQEFNWPHIEKHPWFVPLFIQIYFFFHHFFSGKLLRNYVGPDTYWVSLSDNLLPLKCYLGTPWRKAKLALLKAMNWISPTSHVVTLRGILKWEFGGVIRLSSLLADAWITLLLSFGGTWLKVMGLKKVFTASMSQCL